MSGRPGGRREIPLPQGSRYSGHGNVLHDLAAAIHTGQKPVHDGRWGKATLDAALAIQASAREGREIMLKLQVAV